MDIIIFPAKRRFPITLFAWVIIFFCFAWSVAYSPVNIFPGGDMGNRFFELLLLGSVSYHLGLAAANYIYAMMSPNANLIVNSEGIDDCLTIYSMGGVKWSDIDTV